MRNWVAGYSGIKVICFFFTTYLGVKHLWERTNFWDLNSILLVLQLIMFSYLPRSLVFRPEGETCLGAKESTNQQMAWTNCPCLVFFPKCLFIAKISLHILLHLFNTFYISLGVFNPSERYSSLVYFNSMLISRSSGLRPRRCGRSKASPTYQADRNFPSPLGNSSTVNLIELLISLSLTGYDVIWKNKPD